MTTGEHAKVIVHAFGGESFDRAPWTLCGLPLNGTGDAVAVAWVFGGVAPETVTCKDCRLAMGLPDA